MYENAASMRDIRTNILFFPEWISSDNYASLVVNLKRIVVDMAYILNKTVGVEMCVGRFFPLILGLAILF